MDALHQRIFGANDQHVDMMGDTGFPDSREVIHCDGKVGATLGCPRVARGNKQPREEGALGQLPGDSMFPAS